ncbi:MAG: ABC transporter permease subunit [Pseudonocardiaceae bacterium]|nr:ABC transporter permease subunit [Pseudonocardiaceae bacterium]
MLSSVSAELLKLRKRPATWVLAGAWLSLLLFFGYVLTYLSYRSAGDTAAGRRILADALPANLVANTVGGYALFGGAIVMILGALVAGSEYGWGTLKTVLTQRPGRTSVHLGQVSALAATLLALVLLSFGLAAATSAIIATSEAMPLDWPSAGELATGIAAGWLILGMWCAFGLLLGTLARGPALAVGLGLVWALALENLIRGFAALLDPVATLQRVMPGTNAGSLVAALGAQAQGSGAGGTPGVVAVVDGTQATVVLLGYLIGFVLLAGVLLHRRDVT